MQRWHIGKRFSLLVVRPSSGPIFLRIVLLCSMFLRSTGNFIAKYIKHISGFLPPGSLRATDIFDRSVIRSFASLLIDHLSANTPLHLTFSYFIYGPQPPPTSRTTPTPYQIDHSLHRSFAVDSSCLPSQHGEHAASRLGRCLKT